MARLARECACARIADATPAMPNTIPARRPAHQNSSAPSPTAETPCDGQARPRGCASPRVPEQPAVDGIPEERQGRRIRSAGGCFVPGARVVLAAGSGTPGRRNARPQPRKRPGRLGRGPIARAAAGVAAVTVLSLCGRPVASRRELRLLGPEIVLPWDRRRSLRPMARWGRPNLACEQMFAGGARRGYPCGMVAAGVVAVRTRHQARPGRRALD